MDSQSQRGDQQILNIVGQKVALGPFRQGLLSHYMRWLNDYQVTRTLDVGLRPVTWESVHAWFEGIARREDGVSFAVYERNTQRPIGYAELARIDHRERTGEFGMLIGEREGWGKGYATEVAILVLDFAFNGLGLHNVGLSAFAYNEGALRAFAKAGFRLVGRRREAHRFCGRAFDVVLMDCLATDFPTQYSRIRGLLVDPGPGQAPAKR